MLGRWVGVEERNLPVFNKQLDQVIERMENSVWFMGKEMKMYQAFLCYLSMKDRCFIFGQVEFNFFEALVLSEDFGLTQYTLPGEPVEVIEAKNPYIEKVRTEIGEEMKDLSGERGKVVDSRDKETEHNDDRGSDELIVEESDVDMKEFLDFLFSLKILAGVVLGFLVYASFSRIYKNLAEIEAQKVISENVELSKKWFDDLEEMEGITVFAFDVTLSSTKEELSDLGVSVATRKYSRNYVFGEVLVSDNRRLDAYGDGSSILRSEYIGLGVSSKFDVSRNMPEIYSNKSIDLIKTGRNEGVLMLNSSNTANTDFTKLVGDRVELYCKGKLGQKDGCEVLKSGVPMGRLNTKSVNLFLKFECLEGLKGVKSEIYNMGWFIGFNESDGHNFSGSYLAVPGCKENCDLGKGKVLVSGREIVVSEGVEDVKRLGEEVCRLNDTVKK